jgi:hypothetical protein
MQPADGGPVKMKVKLKVIQTCFDALLKFSPLHDLLYFHAVFLLLSIYAVTQT